MQNKQYRLFFIDEDNIKKYIVENKPTFEAKSTITTTDNASDASVFSKNEPYVTMLSLERNHYYVNLKVEYI